MVFFTVLVVAYCLTAVGVGLRVGGPSLVGFGDYLLAFSSAILLVPVVLYGRSIGRDERSVATRIGDAIRVARRRHLTNVAVIELGASVLLVAMLMGAFNAFKFLLPVLHPFSWDARIEEASRWIHGGHLAFEFLLPVFGSDLATRSLDLLYYGAWPVVLWGVFVWQVGGRSSMRHQYLLTYAAAWIVLGTFLAIVFSSAGPAYFGHLYGGPNPYSPLLKRLLDVHQRHPLLAIRVQQALWNAEKAGIASGGAGVSAMPSLHVAMAELCAIVGRRSERRVVAYSLTAFSALTLIASVYLGAHYALDGYVSIIGVHLLWRASGYLVKRYETVDRSVLAFSPALVRAIPEAAPRSVAEAP
jgi:hypothetical protein